MRQTTNYQLSQWDASDRILREDFNADNAKLDAAVANLSDNLTETAAQLRGENVRVKLLDKSLATAASSMLIDLSVLDLSPYLWVELYASFPAGNLDPTLHLEANSYNMGSSITRNYAAVGASDSDSHAGLMAWLWTYPGGNLIHCVSMAAGEGGPAFSHSTCQGKLAQQSYCYLSEAYSYNLPAGSRVRLYGVRA